MTHFDTSGGENIDEWTYLPVTQILHNTAQLELSTLLEHEEGCDDPSPTANTENKISPEKVKNKKPKMKKQKMKFEQPVPCGIGKCKVNVELW